MPGARRAMRRRRQSRRGWGPRFRWWEQRARTKDRWLLSLCVRPARGACLCEPPLQISWTADLGRRGRSVMITVASVAVARGTVRLLRHRKVAYTSGRHNLAEPSLAHALRNCDVARHSPPVRPPPDAHLGSLSLHRRANAAGPAHASACQMGRGRALRCWRSQPDAVRAFRLAREVR